MFSYYGSKSKLAHLYPPPLHDHIIEPFAGAAKYSLRYADRQVTLVEICPKICAIWRWLIEASVDDVLALPDLPLGADIRDYKFPDPVRWLLGFTAGASAAPRNIVTKNGAQPHRPRTSKFTQLWRNAEKYLPHIRHWQVVNSSYADFQHDAPATWFVDPPYAGPAGRHYPHSNIDYGALAEWCKSRNGQVIVCEGGGADWLPFTTLRAKYQGCVKASTELIWTTHPEIIPEQPAKCRPKKRSCNV